MNKAAIENGGLVFEASVWVKDVLHIDYLLCADVFSVLKVANFGFAKR